MKTVLSIVATLFGLGLLALIGLAVHDGGMGLKDLGIAAGIAMLQVGACLSGWLLESVKGTKPSNGR